jgi:protein phosphatase
MSKKIEFNGICDKGLKREINQDHIYMKSKMETALFVVADGIGGHLHGEKASEHIIFEFGKWYDLFDCNYYMDDFNKMITDIQCLLEQMNKTIYELYDNNVVCGSTVVVLFIYKDMYAVFWSGDSRAYILDMWKYKILTIDDVWENQSEIRFNLSKEKIEENINYGRLVNSIGITETARINIRTDSLKRGTKFLICSDGLYKMCTEKEIKKMLRGYKGNNGGDILMKEYLNMVYMHGAVDNVSFIFVECI